MNKAGGQVCWLSRDLYLGESFHDFLPDYPQLHFGEAITHATVDAITKSGVLTRVAPIYDELVGIIKRIKEWGRTDSEAEA